MALASEEEIEEVSEEVLASEEETEEASEEEETKSVFMIPSILAD